MGLRINTNVDSINAQRNLHTVTDLLSKSFRRLSTGLRITVAADDAAGLAISERLRARLRSVDQAQRNANEGISLAQTAEGSLNEVSNILIRMRELAVQASNGTLSASDKATLESEFATLKSEVDRIANAAEFNGIKLLDGSTTQTAFHIGAGTKDADNKISVTTQDINVNQLSIDGASIGAGGNTSAAIADLDTTIDTISSLRGKLGAVQSRLTYTINTLSAESEGLAAATGRIRDVDYALETSNLTRYAILQKASLAVLGQANSTPEGLLSLL